MNCFTGLTGALMIGFIGLVPQLSSAATYYVSSSGHDANTGASWHTAKKTWLTEASHVEEEILWNAHGLLHGFLHC